MKHKWFSSFDLKSFQTKRRRVSAGLVAAAVLLAVVIPLIRSEQAEAWWNASWPNRRKITLNNSASAENLVNFPIRVSLSSGNIDYSKTQNSGQDLRFVDADDTTALSYEIETWNEAGTSEVWVKVPQVDAGSTTDFIYMYYGNDGAAAGQSPSAVWDSSTLAKWNLKEDPAATCSSTQEICDSTANAVHGDAGGSMPSASQIAGKVNGSLDFDGVNDYVNFGTGINLSGTANMTISGWVRLDTAPAGRAQIVSTYDAGTAGEWYFGIDVSRRLGIARECGGYGMQSSGTIPLGTWTHVATTYNGSLTTYINGQLDNTLSDSCSIANTSVDLVMGAGDNGTGAEDFFDGAMDNLSVSNIARSADWIEAEYISSNNAMNSFGSEEVNITNAAPAAPVLIAPSDGLAGVSTTPSFTLRSSDADNDYLRYRIQICSTSTCSSVVRTIDQTASQTGWSGQDTQTGTAYVGNSTLTSSTIATHNYQSPALSNGTQYWWRAYAIDPGGTNTWSTTSSIQSFTTVVAQTAPSAPTLIFPAPAATDIGTAPPFTLRSSDANNDYLRYRIQVCSTSTCSAIVRTIDQTASQTGWSGQDTEGSTAYIGDSVLSGSTEAAYTYQPPSLSPGTQYWWRGYAIDPGGSNTWSPASAINAFTIGSGQTTVQGGTRILGGTSIGN